MALDAVIDAEVVEPLNRDDAERLDKRMRLLVGTINDNLTKLSDLVEEAKRGNIHATLGFPSWTAYLADVFTVDVRLEREQRRELVGYLSGEGMSNRAIADVIGASKSQVSRDIAGGVPNGTRDEITGLDGKTYRRRHKPPPEPDDPVSVLRATTGVTHLLVETLYKRHPLTLDNADDIQHAEAILGNLDAIKELIEAARQNTAPFTHGRRENRPTGQLGGRNRHSEPTKD